MASNLVTDVEICTEKGKEKIKIRHDYSDERVIEKLEQLFSNVFDAGWHKFSVISVSELIIFDFSPPDVPEGDTLNNFHWIWKSNKNNNFYIYKCLSELN